MKRIITGCLLLNFAMAAQAECNISSSIQNIDYGKRSAAMRQVDRGKTTQLADRTITLVMQCDQDAHIRVQLNTANISNNGFGFWICPYISRHLLSLNPLLACCRRYSRGER